MITRKKSPVKKRLYTTVFRGCVSITEEHILLSDTLEPFYIEEGSTAYMDDTLYIEGTAAVLT